MTALGGFFVACVLSIGPLAALVQNTVPADVADIVRISTESRPVIWAMFLDASLDRPVWGYGWGQVAMAHIHAALDHPPLYIYFSHSHNLFLDLVLWCGWPLGLLASAYLLWWFVSRGLRVRCAEDAVLFLVLLIVGNHAMLELPLHHAYFLLPAGLVMGALDIRLGVRPRWPASLRATWASWSAWLFAAVLLALTIRDYARVEPSFQSLRFEWANVKTEPAKVPDVVLLTQWRDFVQFAKFDLAREVTDADLQWMQDQASLRPNTGFFQVLAMSLARRGQPELAAHWLRTMCTVVAKGACAAVRASWAYQAAHDPRLAAVPWPR